MKESLLFEIGHSTVSSEKPKYLYGLVARSLCRKHLRLLLGRVFPWLVCDCIWEQGRAKKSNYWPLSERERERGGGEKKGKDLTKTKRLRADAFQAEPFPLLYHMTDWRFFGGTAERRHRSRSPIKSRLIANGTSVKISGQRISWT